MAIPYFWEKFDKEGWSIWRANYNYNDELTRGFMASNLVSGMFQRLEKLHKYGFAVVYILGEDMALEISGVWVLRGEELAFDVSFIGSQNYLVCVVSNPQEIFTMNVEIKE